MRKCVLHHINEEVSDNAARMEEKEKRKPKNEK